MRTVSVIALMFLILSYTMPAEGDSNWMNTDKASVTEDTSEDEDHRSKQAQPATTNNTTDQQMQQFYQPILLEPAEYESIDAEDKSLISRGYLVQHNEDSLPIELVVMSGTERQTAQAVAEAQALADVAFKAQAEIETKAQAEAEAKAQAEAEAKAEAEAAAKAQAEAEAKAQAEAEAKAQAEAAAKAQAEAEAKAKAEAADAKAEAKSSKKMTARVTAYAPYDNHSGICNDGNPSVTSTGQRPGPTIIAVDPKKIPYGTKLKIKGFDRTFVAGDTGSALRRYNGVAIDVYFETYREAIKFGVQYLEIEIIDT